MNILIISYYFPPDLGAGAFRIGALSDLLHQDSSVKNVKVLCAKPNRYKGLSEIQRKSSKRYSIKTFWIPSHSNSFLSQSFSYSFFFFQAFIYSIFIRKKFIVLGTSSRFFTMFLSYLIALIRREKLIIDLRDIFSEALESNFTQKNSVISRYFLRILYAIESLCLNYASLRVQVSPRFESYYRNSVKKEWLNCMNGIDEEFLDIKPISTRKSGATRVLYAGNIGIAQSLSKVIPRAALKLLNFEFIIIGDGTDRKSLEREILQLGVKNVLLKRPIKRDDLIIEYLKADILLLHLNDIEAYKRVIPSKIFEFASFNKPICAGISGFAKEFVEENITNGYIFKQNSPADLINTLSDINLDSKNIKYDQFILTYSRKNQLKSLIHMIKSMN